MNWAGMLVTGSLSVVMSKSGCFRSWQTGGAAVGGGGLTDGSSQPEVFISLVIMARARRI